MRRAGEYPTMLQECGLGSCSWAWQYHSTAACGAFISGPGSLESVSPRGPGTSDGHEPRGQLAAWPRSNNQHAISNSALSRPHTSAASPLPRFVRALLRPLANVVAPCLKPSPLIHGPVDANDQTMTPRFERCSPPVDSRAPCNLCAHLQKRPRGW